VRECCLKVYKPWIRNYKKACSISNKASILETILNIEDEINRLRKDPTYMKIKKSLKKIERINFGSRLIRVPSPDDLEKDIEIRKRSKEMAFIKERYRERLVEFDEKLVSLHKDRKNLVKQLFG